MLNVNVSLAIILVFLPTLLFAQDTKSDAIESADYILPAAIDTQEMPKCTSDECHKKMLKIRKFAFKGNPEAQVLIAMAYYSGEGFSKNLKKASAWLLKAHDGGSSKATWLRSRLYRRGDGVEKNTERAEYLLSLAAQRGYGPALFEKAMQTFDLTAQENKKEIKLLQYSAESGYRPAIYLLAKIYESGTSTSQNLLLSAQLYNNLKSFQYKDSEHGFERVAKKAQLLNKGLFEKIIALNSDIEIIEITHQGFNYDLSLDYALARFKDERSIYDGKGGMSHIQGRVCNRRIGCELIMQDDDIADFFGRH